MSEISRAWSDLHRWYRSDEGRRCADVEAKALRKMLSSLFGICIVTLGMPAGEIQTGGAFARHYQIEVAASQYIAADIARADMLSEPAQLPLANESVDTVILPHILQFSEQPQAVLDEVNRILKPDGHLVIVMFNALSLLSFWRWLKGRFGNDLGYRAFSYLRQSNVISLLYHLGKRDFETIDIDYLRYFSDIWRWPGSHGAVILARKRVIPLTIIKPGWRAERFAAESRMAQRS